MNTIALIVAGGRGERLGGEIPKQYQLVAERPLMSWTISRFEKASLVDRIVIVAGEDYLLHVNNSVVNPYGFKKVSNIVPGGDSRAESVYKGLEALPLATSYVAVHDAVRPLVTPGDIDRVIEEARRHRAAVLGRPVTDTVKRAREGMIMATLDRSHLFLAETPQAFQYDLLKEAYIKGMTTGLEATDDAAMVEAHGFMVKLVPSSSANPKLTTSDDMAFIKMMLEREKDD